MTIRPFPLDLQVRLNRNEYKRQLMKRVNSATEKKVPRLKYRRDKD